MSEEDDCYPIYNVWNFIHSDDFTTDIIIEEVKETYSNGPAETSDGQLVEQDDNKIQFYSYTKGNNNNSSKADDADADDDTEDEDDVHEEKFLLRFLATNTDSDHRYLWVNDSGDVRTDGGRTNIATFFEVIHWCSPHQNNYQLICYGGLCKGYILYMDSTELKTRKYHPTTDDNDITTKFQMSARGNDISVHAFISKTGIPIYFDDDGNYRPEGPTRDSNSREESDSELHPLYFITSNVKVLKVTSV